MQEEQIRQALNQHWKASAAFGAGLKVAATHIIDQLSRAANTSRPCCAWAPPFQTLDSGLERACERPEPNLVCICEGNPIMRYDLVPGAVFPDYQLPDHTGTARRLSELQGDDPLILTLARGHYCPKEHQQHLELAAFYPKIAVGYTQIVTISTDDHHTLQEFRASVGAEWAFLSDPERTVQKELDIMGSRNALPQDFRQVIRMLEERRFPVDDAVTSVLPILEAPDILRAWSDNPARFTKIMIHLD